MFTRRSDVPYHVFLITSVTDTISEGTFMYGIGLSGDVLVWSKVDAFVTCFGSWWTLFAAAGT